MVTPPDEGKVVTAQAAVVERERVGRFRFALAGLLLVMMAIGAADRVNVSVLLTDGGFLQTMGIEHDPTAQGALMSAFVLLYGFSNVLLGPMVDWIGSRRALMGMVVVWAALAAALGSVSAFFLMIVGRGVRGASEGPVFPTMNRFARSWFPRKERGRANAIWLSGTSLGMAVAIPLLAAIIAAFGWRASLYGVAAMTLVVGLPVAFLLIAERPEESRWVKPAELEHIRRGETVGTLAAKRRWRDARLFIGDYHYWLLVCYHSASLAILWGLVTWIPKYLVEARGLQILQSGLLASLPYLLSGMATLVFGSLADRFERQAPFCAVQTIGAAAAIFGAAYVADATFSAVLLAVGFGLWGVGSAVSHTILQRIVPANVISTGSGIDNGISNLAAAACPALIGYTIAVTGAYSAGLMVLVAMGVVGGVFMVILSVQKY